MDGITFQGLRVTEKYLTVSFTERIGGVPRFKSVKMPLEALLDDEVLYQIYRAAAKSLRLAWEDDGEVIPLFDV